MTDLVERFHKYQRNHAQKCGKIDWGPCQYCRDMKTAAKQADEIERLEDMLDHICEASADDYRHSLLNAAKDVGEIERLEAELKAQAEANTTMLLMGAKSQDRVAELEGALNSAAGALTYYAEANYHENSDIQAGCAIETLDEIEQTLGETK